MANFKISVKKINKIIYYLFEIKHMMEVIYMLKSKEDAIINLMGELQKNDPVKIVAEISEKEDISSWREARKSSVNRLVNQINNE